MSKPRLTIGIATHNDFDGLYFSLNALRMYVPDVSECELIVVDNAPESRAGKRAEGLVAHINAGRSAPKPGDTIAAHSARWIPFGGIEGTAAPRQKIFDEAAADWVLVMDSHVLLHPMALPALFDFMDRDSDSRDLISGPMMLDSHRGILTQFDDIWRDGMWGIWGHDPRGEHPDFGGEFEIPAMGLGLFACRREAWLGFNPHFREFGGEEFYIHTKFRQAGATCLCLPMLRWQHRFGDPEGGRKSPLSLHGKVRNYILGHQELGIPLDRLRRHYVDGINEDTGKAESKDGRLSPLQFDTLARMAETYPPVSAYIN
jgi:hypothetical protein